MYNTNVPVPNIIVIVIHNYNMILKIIYNYLVQYFICEARESVRERVRVI